MRAHVCKVLRWVCAGALALAAGLAWAQPLRVAASRGPVSLMVYAAEAQGFFRQEGVEVRVLPCASGRHCAQMLQEGAADAATASEFVVALHGTAAPELAVLATVSTSSHQIKLIARRSAGIEQPAQLRGKRVGTVVDTSAHYFLASWLLFHDIDPRRLTTVPLAPEQFAGAFARQQVDAAAIWEPVAGALLKELGDDGIALPNPRVYTQHFTLLMPRAQVTAREADVRRLLRALLRAQGWIAREPAAAARLLGTRLGQDETAAQALMREHDYRLRLDQSLLSTMGSQLRWVARDGHGKGDAPADLPLRLIEPGPLRQVAPEAVTVVR